MKRLCLFSSYFDGSSIPYYVKVYLGELRRHFSDVVFLTNRKKLKPEAVQYLEQLDIRLELVENEGYDFGMWYKALQHTALGGYDALCLANDSCILFRSLAPFLQWADGSPCHYCGITDSGSISYHVQSYFVLVKKPALAAVSQYFSRHGIVRQLDDVIRRYEIGLSTHLLKENLAVGALFNHQAYLPNGGNPAYHAIAPLIRDGIPLIKKRIVYGTHRKSDLVHLKNVNLDPAYYLALIREATSPEEARVFNHDLLFKQESTSFFRKLFYR